VIEAILRGERERERKKERKKGQCVYERERVTDCNRKKERKSNIETERESEIRKE